MNHNNQSKDSNQMGYVTNKGVRKGGCVHWKKFLEVIGTTKIKEIKWIKWNKSQIRVPTILHPEEYYNDRMPKFLIGKIM